MANMNEATKKVHQRLGEVENLLLDILKSMNTAEERADAKIDSIMEELSRIRGLEVAANIILNVILIKHFYALGAAIATAMSSSDSVSATL